MVTKYWNKLEFPWRRDDGIRWDIHFYKMMRKSEVSMITQWWNIELQLPWWLGGGISWNIHLKKIIDLWHVSRQFSDIIYIYINSSSLCKKKSVCMTIDCDSKITIVLVDLDFAFITSLLCNFACRQSLILTSPLTPFRFCVYHLTPLNLLHVYTVI